MGHFIATVFIGFFAGLIARALHPGNDKSGFIVTTILGIAGSFVATYAGRFLGLYSAGSSAGFIASIVGAVIILVLYGFFTKKD